ncbi:MAG: Ig-like domain-containing protein [Tannerellaceae bacterium]|jgi:uncharacterized protein YjdB|nr:Ig-like domain-containing protein [Tannerellaceae bacterium]
MTVEPKGEACTLRFIESGVVRLRATVMWKDSKGAFQEGVSDTVEFTVPLPNFELKLYSVRADAGGIEINTTYPPFNLRLYGSEKFFVKLFRDNNPIAPDDPLIAQLKGIVFDSTVVAVEKIELDGVVRHDTFKVTALAHKEKDTKVWVGDSLELSGKKYAINCVDTFRVKVAPIHLKITDDSPQNGAILFQNRPYEWQAEATFADHTPVTPTPHVTWKASQGTLTAQTDGDGNTKWCLTDTGTVMVWAETYYETKVGDRDTIICGVASDTVTVKVPAPKIDIEVGTGLVFGSQRRMRPVVHSDGELTDTLGLRWISRNERIVTVNEDGNGDVYFIPNDVQSCAWVVVEAYYRHDPAKRMLAVDSSEICIDDAVMKIILLNNEEPAQTQVKLNREREFTVAVIYNGDTLPAPYDKQLIWEVWPIDEVEAIKCFDWDSLAMKIKIRGIAAGKSELVPSVKNVSGNFVKTNTIPFEVPKPILAVKVNKVKHPQEEVIQLYLDSLGGEEKELYATVVSDGEDLAKPDSIEIIWEVSDPSVLYLFSSTAENTPEIGSSTPEIRAKSNNMRIWAKGSGAVTVTARTEGGISLAEWAVAVAEPPVTVAFDKQNYGPMQIEKTLPLPVPTVKSYGKVTTKYAVTWESLNTEVLEVNGTEIYARNVGEAWLVARVRGLVVQRPADSVLVTVLHPDVQITFTPGPGELPMLKRKETCQLRATVKVNGVERTDIPVRWHSSRADVATVTPTASDGQTVTLQASSTPTLTEGERTTIAAEILSRWGNKDGGPWLKQVDVFVDKSDVLVEPVEVALRVGESKLLSGYKTMIDNVSAALGSFASSPEGVVSVNEDGMVTAIKEGTGVAIYAYVLNPVDNTPFVSKQIATLTVSPREIEMTPKGFLMSVKQDSAKVFPSVQVIVNDVEVFPTADAWESSKPAVAKLTLSGDDPALVQAIEGVSPGSADIRLIVDGDKRTVFTVTVPERIYEISPIEKPIKIKNGSVWSLSEVAQNIGLSTVVDGTALGAADRLWTSSEPAVLTVDDGKMTAVANGEAAVTVTVKGRTATVAMVTVYTPVVTVTPLNYQMWVKLDSTIPFPAVKIVDDGKELSPAACLQSSDYTVAALSDDALSVTGNKEGSAEIYAEVEGKRYVLFKVIVPKQTFSVTPINQQLVLKVGEQRTLAVLAAVDGTEMTDNYWYSSNPGVVPVAAGEDAAHRVITGLKAGQADIKVVVKDSTFIVATVDVPEPVYTLTLSGASSILQHMEDTLFAAVKCDGNLVNGILPRWEAPEGLILSAQTGDKVAVRAMTPGAYTVVATLEGVQPPVSAEYAVVVPEPVITVSIPEHLDTIDSRASVRLVAEVTLNGIVVDTIPVTFDVLTPDLADKVLGSEGTTSVSIYGKKTGEVTVRATLHGGSILSNLCTFFIRKPKVTILASAASHTINVRGTFTPYVEVEYSPGKINVGMANERWSASDTSIISVDSITGRVTGRKAGVADLTVRIPEGGVSEPFTVTVLPPTVKVRIQGGARIDSAEIRLGQMLLLEADAIYNGNVSESNVKATWIALNPLVVDVDGLFGVVTAQQTGVTWVEVLTADGGKASVKIHVLNPFVVITTTAATDTVRVGETILLKAYVGYDYDSRIPDVALTWTVEPRNIASVNGGLVTGLQKGTAVVTATAPAIYGAEWATYEVVVSGLPTAIGALPEERYAARIESDGLRLTGFSPQDEVTVYTLGGRILLRAQAGDGFIPHAFSYGVYIVRTAKGNVKAVFLR